MPGKLLLLRVGAMKDGPWKDLAAHYTRLLGREVPLEQQELPGGTAVDGGKAMAEENERMQRAIRRLLDDGWVVVLATEKGKCPAGSVAFAQWLGALAPQGQRVALVVAGPRGYAADTLTMTPHHLALGPLTMPHEMAAVVLAEQLYRAMTIIKGKTYNY